MILPDTSLWIDWIRDLDANRQARKNFTEFVTCGPVLLEVLQGIQEGPFSSATRVSLLAVPRIGDPMPLEIFLQAAEIYKDGRRRGYTIRSSMDCLIAAVAIEHGATVWHKDRDYDTIARFTPLRVVRSIR